MVRTAGMNYTCSPHHTIGNRISDMQLRDGTRLSADKTYKVAGWATTGSASSGENIWDLVARYLRDKKTVHLDRIEVPRLKGVKTNPGLADYLGES